MEIEELVGVRETRVARVGTLSSFEVSFDPAKGTPQVRFNPGIGMKATGLPTKTTVRPSTGPAAQPVAPKSGFRVSMVSVGVTDALERWTNLETRRELNQIEARNVEAEYHLLWACFRVHEAMAPKAEAAAVRAATRTNKKTKRKTGSRRWIIHAYTRS